MGLASLAQQNAVSGQADIFGVSLGAQSQALNLPAAEPWLAADKLHREFQVVGFYLSAHPLVDRIELQAADSVVESIAGTDLRRPLVGNADGARRHKQHIAVA